MSVSRDAYSSHISRFRWVFCQLETLRRSVNRNLRGILEKLPKTLDETYERVLKDINEDNRDHARRLLHCLAVAIRPLRVEELSEILAFDFDAADIEESVPKFRADWRSKDQEWAVLSTCSSLITVVDGSDDFFGKCRVVQFSHFSVKEFLLSDRLASPAREVSRYRILPGLAHTIFAQACLGFLLHLDTPTDEETGKRFPLAWYAARHWVTHAQFEDVASHVKDGIELLFDPDKRHLVAWLGIYNIDHFHGRRPSTINPLYYAALCGFYDLVESLVFGRPQLINTVGGEYDFPVLAALSGKYIQVAEFLLRHGAKVNIQGAGGLTPLQMMNHFPKQDLVGVASFLLKHGADVNFRASNLSTPLHKAIYVRRPELVQFLLENGADIDSRDGEGSTMLHALYGVFENIRCECNDEARAKAEVGARDILELLLNHGANVNLQDNDGATPLLLAARGLDVDYSSILLEHGAETNMKNKDGKSPLHEVFKEFVGLSFSPYYNFFHCSIAQLLLEHGANANDKDKDYTTPLHLAMEMGFYDAVQILLEHDAEPSVANKDGITPLHLVFEPRYYHNYRHHSPENNEVVAASFARLLLDHGADVNAMDKDHTTPLLLAVQWKMYDITRNFVSRGAEPNVKNDRGTTPLHLLLDGKFSNEDDIPDLVRLFLDHGADVDARDKNHATPLLLAAEEHMDDIARILLERGAYPNVKNIWGKTPLHLLLERDFTYYDDVSDVLVVERLLLERGADVNAQDNDNLTPLCLAYVHRRFEIAQIIIGHANGGTDRRTRTPHAQLHVTLKGEYNFYNMIVTAFHSFNRMFLTHDRAEHRSHNPPTFGMLLREA